VPVREGPPASGDGGKSSTLFGSIPAPVVSLAEMLRCPHSSLEENYAPEMGELDLLRKGFRSTIGA